MPYKISKSQRILTWTASLLFVCCQCTAAQPVAALQPRQQVNSTSTRLATAPAAASSGLANNTDPAVILDPHIADPDWSYPAAFEYVF